MTWYELSRKLFNFSFENYKCWVYHIALFMWIIELNNRLWWKKQFWLPTKDTMEWLHIGNKNTYYSTLKDLVEWWFITIVQESKNQYQSTIIEICCVENEPALMTALDTALIQHWYQQSTSIDTSSVPIDKQVNKETTKPRKKKQVDTTPQNPEDTEKPKEEINQEEWTALLEWEETFSSMMAQALVDIWWKPDISVEAFVKWVKKKMNDNRIEECEKDFYKLKSELSWFVDHYQIPAENKKIKDHKSRLWSNFCLKFNLK